jgi:protein ImuA
MISCPASLATLRDRIRALEAGSAGAARTLPFGAPAIDAALPGGGLALGALHEIASVGRDEEEGTLAAAFAAGILARLAAEGPVLWVLAAHDLYGPGLALGGLAPADLVVASGHKDAEILWAMEEALRSPGLAAVVGEVGVLDTTASRRLQLAAESSGVTAFVIRRWRTGAIAAQQRAAPIAAATRWRVEPAPGALAPGEPGVGRPRWRLELRRCRGGRPGSWLVEPRPNGQLAVVPLQAFGSSPSAPAAASRGRAGSAGEVPSAVSQSAA